jgi:hypothetical protein
VKHWWQIGSLLPALMLVAFLCDIGMRFMPLEFLTFRAWERALTSPEGTNPEPFHPGRVVLKKHAYGDLASLGNLPSLREYRDEEFRADKFGYRNFYAVDQLRSAGIVVGDSFVVASSVPADRTLSGDLSKLDGGYYYNAGRLPPPTPDVVSLLLSNLKIPSGTMIYVLLERRARSAPPSLDPAPSGTTAPPRKFGQIKVRGRGSRAWLKLYEDRSPAGMISRKIMRLVQNDVLQPNIYAGNVVRRTLQNDDEMLFFPADLEPVGDVGALSSAWAAYLKSFANRMAERNLETVVLLVPNKFTVYNPLLKGVPAQPGGELLMAGIQRELRSANLPVVNVTSVYQSDAEKGLAQKSYLYWRDDTHWNANGIEVAARQLIPCIQAIRNSPASGDLRLRRP